MAQTESCSSKQVCPHWSQRDRRCLLSQKGLFLPVTEHVEIYCEGGNYSSCSQYMRQALRPPAGTVIDQGVNRRRHRRVPGRFFFRLAESAGGEDLNQLIDDAAITVDLSRGGIRFESYRALPEGAEIHFSLNGDFSSVPLRGIGQVKWCRSLDDAPLYHAGISFADTAVADAISDRFDLSTD